MMIYANLALTPTLRKSVDQRAAFRRRLEKAAEDLRISKLAPEAIPAQPDPPVWPAHIFAEGNEPAAAKPVAMLENWQTRTRNIQDLVCRHLGVKRIDLLSGCREREIVIARQIAVYLCHAHTPNSLAMIGHAFGGRHHTTVLNSVRLIRDVLSTPKGANCSRQYPAQICNYVRRRVAALDFDIASWPDDSSRARYPSRSA